MNYAYKCKFCQRPGILTLDDSGIEFCGGLERLRKMAACNPCADFMVSKRSQIDRIRKACFTLLIARQSGKESELGSTISEKLVKLTKRLAVIVCDYNRKTNVWDSAFVEMLIDHPERASEICNRYTTSVARV